MRKSLYLAIMIFLFAVAARKDIVLAEENQDAIESDFDATKDMHDIVTSGEWEYAVLDDNTALIFGGPMDEEEVHFPSTIDGYTVTKLAAYYELPNPEEGTISHVVYIPETVDGIDIDLFVHYWYPKEYHVADENETFEIIDGAIVNKISHTLVSYPAFKEETSFVIPESVTSIGEYAFNGAELSEVILHDGIKSIGEYAFCRCDKLKTIQWPNQIDAIPNGCFEYCRQLEEIILPDSLTKIGDYAFSESGFHSIDFPDSLSTIGARAFSYCYELEKVELPFKLKNLGDGAFEHCDALTSVEFYHYITEIKPYTFRWCKNLQRVAFPSDLKLIGKCAFLECESLNDLALPSRLEKIGNYAFSGCNSLESIHLPDATTQIGECAFNNCENLMDVWAWGAQSIEKWAFNDCTWLMFITLGNNLQHIGDYAFRNCAFRSIGLPESLETMGQNPFILCSNLHTINIPDTNPYFSVADNNLYSEEDSRIICRFGKNDQEKVSVKDGTKIIGDFAFAGYNKVRRFNLPESIEKIGYAAFSACSDYGKPNYLPNLKELEDYAFHGCGFTEYKLPGTIEKIGLNPFRECYNLFYIEFEGDSTRYKIINEALVDTEENILIAFPQSTYTEEFTIPDGITTIGSYAFSLHKWDMHVTVPGSVQDIREGAFSDCPGITRIDLEEGVKKIGVDAFARCESLEYISLPESITNISRDAFMECNVLTAEVKAGSYAEQYCRSDNIPCSVVE